MKAPQPSLTHEWHNNTYAAISPTRPALSAAHKTIIVTGAGSGIGRETVRAYATAGAARIALLGRTLTTLSETKIMVEGEFGATRVSTHVVDIVDEHKLRDVAQDVGHWDVLVLNAGLGMKPAMIAEADVNVWWRVFETNVKGSMVTAHVFLATRKSSAVIISNSAATISVPNTTPISIGSSAYIASKMAQLKLIEHIAAENTDIIAVSVHPGAIETKLLEVFEANVPHLDDVKLPAHFFVWASSPEARFLNGKFVWANWDVEELKERAEEIEGSSLLTANVLGWPFEAK